MWIASLNFFNGSDNVSWRWSSALVQRTAGLEQLDKNEKYNGVTNRATANALVVVKGLEDCKVDVSRFVTQKIRAAAVPRVKISEEVLELFDMRSLVI